MFIKVLFLIIISILIRGTLPRYRIDHLINLNWKVFLFLNIFFIIYLIILFNIIYL